MTEESQERKKGQVLLYRTDDGGLRLECRLEGESLWLSLNQMADLFGRDKSVISKHLKAIYDDAELLREATVAKYATVQTEGGREVERQIEYYNLEAIFAVGYRVRSKRGIQFRTWATTQLKEYLTKGFVMDDERLKNPDSSVYFDQLLARIRDIRSSEKVFWRKVCDIYATSIDYDGKSETSQAFLAGGKANEFTFQNDIIRQLVANGWLLGKPENYNRKLALYEEDLLGFVKDTQDAQWQKFCKLYPNNPEQKFLERVASQLNKADPNAANKEMRTFGTLGVLRHELRDRGTRFFLVPTLLHGNA